MIVPCILAQHDLPERSPVMLFSGGVDSWKMDLHNMIMMFVRDLPIRVIGFDLPGTGESQVHLGRPGTQVIDGLVQTARSMTGGLRTRRILLRRLLRRVQRTQRHR